jgi:hypothetical protein
MLYVPARPYYHHGRAHCDYVARTDDGMIVLSSGSSHDGAAVL